MSRERRRHERRILRIPDKEAFFRLHINGKWHAINSVHDASISGMGIWFTDEVGGDTPAKILFVSHDFEIVLDARVRWCQHSAQDISVAGTTEVYRLGIEFEPSRAEDNMLMFMALRKYLDGFC